MSGVTLALDYPVLDTVDISHRDAMVEALRAHGGQPIRILGSGSLQGQLPPPDRAVTVIRTAGMANIERLDAGDMTCSVEPGVRRQDLDRELNAAGIYLPCRGSGTIGGMLAADLHAAATSAMLGARGVLLGIEGVLAEGLAFKSGARVVKSVAGFDLQKLFVGSRGRLFAATLLHLKLRPLPERIQQFASERRGAEHAWSLFRQLRDAPEPLRDLYLVRDDSGTAVCGELAGRRLLVDELLRVHGLTAVNDGPPPEPSTDRDVVAGFVRPSEAAEFAKSVPANATLTINGSGQFVAALPASAADALLAQCADRHIAAEMRAADATRRGRATPLDPQARRIEQRVRHALDPQEMLR